MPKTKAARAPQPAFLANAQTFYGQAFDHTSNKAIARSMSDWAELDEDEQSFAQAHLLFLNLQAQAATQRLLVQVRDLLDEVAESLTVALEASLVEEDRGGEESDEQDDEVAFDEPDPVDVGPQLVEITQGEGDEDLDEEPDEDGQDEGGAE